MEPNPKLEKPNRVSAIRLGNNISLVIGKKHMMRDTHVDEIQEAVDKFNEDPSDENWDTLIELTNPAQSLISTGLVKEDQMGNIYMEGSKVPLPAMLGKRMLRYIKEGEPIASLKNFWNLALLNEDPVARNDLFDFCDRNNIPITDNGYMLIYKTVTHKPGTEKVDMEKDLRSFVAANYLKVKRQKQSPKHYTVYKDHEGYGSTKSQNVVDSADKQIGNLQELHDRLETLEQATQYTDKYTRKMNIQLGIPVKMDREKCDPDPKVSCSKGLHVGGSSYVQSFGYGYSGYANETILATLVNPMNVVAVPYTTKMRVCEYFPYAVVEADKQTGEWTEVESEYLEEDYFDYEAEDLKKRLKEIEAGTSEDAQTRREQVAAVKDRLVLIGHEGEAHDAIKELTKIIVEEYEDEVEYRVDDEEQEDE